MGALGASYDEGRINMRRWIVVGALGLMAFTVAGASAAPRSRAVGCPRSALPLTANSIAPASQAAFARERPGSRPQVTEAASAPTDTQRGAQVKLECGARVWRRTVVVYITLRGFLPSASLSERVSFVSRFRTGYRVWEIAH
jgi:hypothetical protein